MRIVLIEDEPLAMEELMYILKPYSEQHTLVCYENGEDALEGALKAAPDIIISDIRMPGLSGLETLQRLSLINPQLQAIMLSGYNDFEYARTAIKLGAKEYILKPVVDKELYEVLDRLIASVITEEHKIQMAMDWSLTRMMHGLNNNQEAKREENLSGNWLICVVLLRNWNSEHTWTLSSLSMKLFQEWLQTQFLHNTKCFDMDGHIRIIMIPVLKTDKESNLRQKVNLIHDFVHKHEKVVHTVYHLKKDQEVFEASYRICLRLLEDQARLDMSTFMPILQPQNLISVWDSVRLIELHVRESEYAKLNMELRRMLDSLHRAAINLKQISVFLSDFFYALKYNLNLNKNDMESFSMDSMYEFIKTCDTYSKLQEWLLGKLGGMMVGNTLDKSNPKQIIPVLLDYVQQNYSETIHLQDFAVKYHLSTGYLSKLFKAETGSNFSEYIMEIRMNKAQELINGGYKKIAEISKMVGYEDAKFFSQTFKRWSGVTPQDYKKK
ncbi:response regulator [Paenibacillus psychroresistens]|uniref:Response regulator n=1 Tax=Paenibacillus psychroresistens TaxID=1778678 RepID=A0A6B8RGL6_9BACL|nr:response regulator [Paenibacillus psychroresistens]QGQ94516.1 response regulator [Paenibacillus psychroresistens]